MLRNTLAVTGTAALLGLALACSSSAPLTPTPAGTNSTTGGGKDGSTLKASAPVPQSPIGDQKLAGTPTLTASPSASLFGVGAAFQYRFQIFNPAGALVHDSGVVNSSSYTVSANLVPLTRHTWRVRAEYQGGAGPWSTTESFISPQPFDMHQAIILSNPPDLADWAETAKITVIDFLPNALIVDFDKRTGDGHWPNLPFEPGGPPGGGGIQYTLGMCFKINGQWFCSAVIQFWEGRDLEAAAAPSSVPQTWYYDPARWGPMVGYRPANDEIVGIFVTVGNTRGIRSSAGLLATERSNVVLVPWGGGYRSN